MIHLFSLLIAALLVAVLAVQLMVYRKVQRVDRKVGSLDDRVRGEIRQVFRQVEALEGQYGELRSSTQALSSARGWAGSPAFLEAIGTHVLRDRPETVVECSSGASTIVLARCLQILGRGHVWCLEHEPEYAAATRRQLEEQGLAEWATVIDAPLVDTPTGLGPPQPWYRLDGLQVPSIDTLVVEGPPPGTSELARYPAGPLLMPRLSRRGRVFLDDANRPAERSIVERWMAAVPGLSLTRLPSEKGLACLAVTDPQAAKVH